LHLTQFTSLGGHVAVVAHLARRGAGLRLGVCEVRINAFLDACVGWGVGIVDEGFSGAVRNAGDGDF
jgi:hypothetical protein